MFNIPIFQRMVANAELIKDVNHLKIAKEAINQKCDNLEIKKKQQSREIANEPNLVNTSNSFAFAMDHPSKECMDEYADDDDPGFIVFEAKEEDFEQTCKELAEKYGYPAKSIKIDPLDTSGAHYKKVNKKDNKKDESSTLLETKKSDTLPKKEGDITQDLIKKFEGLIKKKEPD